MIRPGSPARSTYGSVPSATTIPGQHEHVLEPVIHARDRDVAAPAGTARRVDTIARHGVGHRWDVGASSRLGSEDGMLTRNVADCHCSDEPARVRVAIPAGYRCVGAVG